MRQLYSEEVEQMVLACALVDPKLAAEIADKTQESDFYIPVNHDVYKAVCSVLADGGVPDAVMVGERTGNLDYCIDLCRNLPSTHNLKAYLAKLSDYSKERELYEVGEVINQELFYNEDAKTSDRIQRIEAAFTALSTERVPSTVFTLKDAVKEFVAQLEWKNNNPDHQGIKTGLDHYDERINGYNGGEMIVVAGTPGSGKTTLAMQVAREACNNGKRAMIFSLEMPKAQLAQRMIAASHSIPLNALKDGSASYHTEHSRKLAPAAVHSAKMDMVIDDQGGIDILDLKSRARAAHREKNLDVIVVDYLQLANDRRYKERYQVVSSVSRELKALAKELNCPVIALSQLNRAIMNRTDKRPQLSDLRESGQIEQDADIITFVYREYTFNEDCDNPNGVELITRKYRDGEIGTDFAEFEGQYNRFVNSQWRPNLNEYKKTKGGGFNL